MVELVEEAGVLHGYLENQLFQPSLERGKQIVWRAAPRRRAGRIWRARPRNTAVRTCRGSGRAICRAAASSTT